ncbi:hypothetical protein HIM_04156 [Hirsutella minnesotensis 3608]|uniref:Methyltransferase domain-containing protein n=1 Tax=Hirsutella minnesotensis 3608 TaxID=1043627 RepID=A0A0F8A1R1_9HYPO|nr:hypothetical protein HIM_04156 [Hirsutella minnesotensis 3608]
MLGRDHHPPTEKLRLFSSPLAQRDFDDSATDRIPLSTGDKDVEHGPKDGARDQEYPLLKRYTEPTLQEVFFDLFFSSNYSVFSDTQKVTNHSRFKAYIGYFCLLWLTWFLVTLFDVRYVTDSIFSRITRAIQLGVLVGFVVVAPKFDPTDQHAGTMRTMSIILAVSRACLAVEYGSTLLHLRNYRKTRKPLYVQMGMHIAASAVYLGIAFRFRDSRKSTVFVIWYIISAIEAVGSVILSNFSPVLSLTPTHLMKRLTLLTVMIMRDSIITLAKEVVTIVRHPDAWDSTTIGLVTAAVATIYFVFLIYFDCRRASNYLPALRQQLWATLHLPFHLALVLHLQSFTQWLLWAKIWSQVRRLTDFSNPSEEAFIMTATSTMVKDQINASVQHFFADYPVKSPAVVGTINDALTNITEIPDKFWPVLSKFATTGNSEGIASSPEIEDSFATFLQSVVVVVTSLSNILFTAFGIEIKDKVGAKKSIVEELADSRSEAVQFQVQEKIWSHCRLVFAYGYVAAGCTILLMTTLAIIARTRPFTIWPIVRFATFIFLAIGTGLTALLWYDEAKVADFIQSPWVLPTITFVWFVVLIMTHLNGRSSWQVNADAWDQTMGSLGNRYWQLLQKPCLQKLIDVQPGCKILDLATGNGLASRYLASRGATILATDGVPEMLEYCRRRCTAEEAEHMTYRLLDVTKREAFESLLESQDATQGFDVVLINMAIMDIETLDPLADALPRLLKKNGIFVATMLHPVFFTSGARRFVQVVTHPGTGEEVSIRGKLVSEYLNVAPWKGVINKEEPAFQLQVYFHRPLHELLGTFFQRGLVMDAMKEPAFTEAQSQGNNTQLPPIMAFRLRRFS